MIEVIAAADLQWHVDAVPQIAEGEPAAASAVWAEMQTANEPLHDGPICRCLKVALPQQLGEPGVVSVARGQYRSMAVQRDARVGDRGIRMLGCKALIIGRDSRGAEHVAIGQRGTGVLMYPRQWELAPAGSIDARWLNGTLADALVATVRDEGLEELGIDLTSACDVTGPVCLYHDQAALCWDVIVRLDWRGPIVPTKSPGGCRVDEHAWEYADVVWLAQADAKAWHDRSPGALSPPTVAVLRWLGWL